jgi:hypothetical protein
MMRLRPKVEEHAVPARTTPLHEDFKTTNLRATLD